MHGRPHGGETVAFAIDRPDGREVRSGTVCRGANVPFQEIAKGLSRMAGPERPAELQISDARRKCAILDRGMMMPPSLVNAGGDHDSRDAINPGIKDPCASPATSLRAKGAARAGKADQYLGGMEKGSIACSAHGLVRGSEICV
jgi:hypothetical protein